MLGFKVILLQLIILVPLALSYSLPGNSSSLDVENGVTSTSPAKLKEYEEVILLDNWCFKHNRSISPVGNCTSPRQACWNDLIIDDFNSDSSNLQKINGNWTRVHPKDFCFRANVPEGAETIPVTLSTTTASFSTTRTTVTSTTASVTSSTINSSTGKDDSHRRRVVERGFFTRFGGGFLVGVVTTAVIFIGGIFLVFVMFRDRLPIRIL